MEKSRKSHSDTPATPAFAEPATATAAATPTIEEMKVLFRI
jgi:hypothetical protein